MADPRNRAPAPPPPPSSPRRRGEERHAFRVAIDVKCSSWERFHQLFSLNIARSGLFVPTERAAQLDEAVELRLRAPDGSVLSLHGRVRHTLPAAPHRPAGLGVELSGVAELDRARYQELVQRAATANAVYPDSTPSAPAPSRGDAAEAKAQAAERSLPAPEADPGGPASPSARGSGARPSPPAAAVAPRATPAPPQGRPAARAAPLVAIDLGTSRSSVAAVVGRTVSLVRLPDGGWDSPSVVGFAEDGAVIVGHGARQLLATDPRRALGSPKRLLGRLYDESALAPYLATLAIPHARGPAGEIQIHVDRTAYSIEQLCATLIHRLKQAAEAFLGHAIAEVVLSAPVGFDECRYEALREAARIAGLRVSEFVDEPTAAALTHRFDQDFRGLVAVYDYGGGTFDFSIVDASAADVHVVATAGDTWLGGDDFDAALAGAAADDFWRQHRIELRHQAVQWQRLLFAAERAKRELSTHDETVVRVPDVALRQQGTIGLEFTVTRARFAELSREIVERSFETCTQALELSDVSARDLNAIYLSGGTTYIPAVREAVARFFGKQPRAAVPPERAVVTGAAIYAALLRSGAIQS
ncbi:MAG: Hsp70 family protein [Proteobacteria bacterium]|nr:Hsp70 family protein [Pseudomonadota bacterium]